MTLKETRDRLAQIDLKNLGNYIDDLVRERDEARTEVQDWRLHQEQTARERDALMATVERLRAAPQLPDVGPVTRRSKWGSGDLEVDGVTATSENGAASYREGAEKTLRLAARQFAVAAFLEAEAADPTPDTSRVTFGARHEGMGMVLLQHADLVGSWGDAGRESLAYHRDIASRGGEGSTIRAAHAALGEVREALNTAEADGVDVDEDGFVWSSTTTSSGRLPDDPSSKPKFRANRYLAREVQALVDQGLRGDDLNARLPYAVRDHRVLVEAAAPDNDDEFARLAADKETATAMKAEFGDLPELLVDADWVTIIRAIDAHRARSAEGGVTK